MQQGKGLPTFIPLEISLMMMMIRTLTLTTCRDTEKRDQQNTSFLQERPTHNILARQLNDNNFLKIMKLNEWMNPLWKYDFRQRTWISFSELNFCSSGFPLLSLAYKNISPTTTIIIIPHEIYSFLDTHNNSWASSHLDTRSSSVWINSVKNESIGSPRYTLVASGHVDNVNFPL